MRGAILLLPQYAFMAQGQLYFLPFTLTITVVKTS